MSKPLDFTKVESLRRHMLLTQGDMASLLSVSRMTYYSWVGGHPIRKKNDEKVRDLLRKFLIVVKNHGWPTPEIQAMTHKQRRIRLAQILDEQQ